MERNSLCVEIARRAFAICPAISRGSQHEHEKFFIHGDPDCPKIWTPLVHKLGLSDGDYFEPALPGFEAPPPKGLKRTKNSYFDFLAERLEDAVRAYDLFGSVGGGQSWADTYGFLSVRIDDAAHWVIAERPGAVATAHVEHWQQAERSYYAGDRFALD